MSLNSIPIDPRAALIAHMANLDDAEVIELVKLRIANGDNPFSIVEDCREGLRLVGERYERREYFLSGLIMAGEIFQDVMDLLDQIITGHYQGNELGTILLGTVAGDIHNIGKNILSMLLTSYGFNVHDLGVDVPAEEFVRRALDLHPDAIGLSGLLTSSHEAMKGTIQLIRSQADPSIQKIPILIGGGTVNEQVNQYVGGDDWANDAMVGVRLFTQLLEVK